MFRKYLFLGLMLALGASLAWLVISGRRQEKLEQKRSRPVEIVQNSKPSATRVYSPDDLQVQSIRMEPVTSADNPPAGPYHTLEIRNVGTAAYANLLVKISYFGPDGKLFDSRDYMLNKSIPPAQTAVFRDISVAPLSRRPARFSGEILFADLEPPGAAKP
jgi:hypothetical protein